MNNSLNGRVFVRDRVRTEANFTRALFGIFSAMKKLVGGLLPVITLILIAPAIAAAQGSSAPARVTDRVDLTRLTTLTGNTHRLAQAQYDQGAAPPDLPMNRIMLVLKRSPDQEAALQDLLVQQQVTTSPTFHKWLTPDQFGQQFGPADTDIQAVTTWLSSLGFQSIKVSKGRTVIEFSGTAAQVEAGLHAPIHRYSVDGKSHWANANDPQIPAALVPVISGFASIHNFQKKPASIRSDRLAILTRIPNGSPQITFTDGSHGVGPGDFNTIYSVASSMTGSGVTIGVIARSNIIAQDVTDFRNLFSLSGSGPNIILNGPDPGDLGMGEEFEAVLDATWTGAVAPSATVDLVVSETTNAAPGEDLSEFYIIDNNLADVMTESFSGCEAGLGSALPAAAAFYSSEAEQAAAQGITYLVSSGDGGPDSCDDQTSVPATLQPASVNLLAATPFTVAVGGTEFNDTSSPGTYWNTNNSVNLASAKTYIPEKVWNESCTIAQCGSMSAGLWSSGGGQSSIFAKPPWQAGVAGIPSGNRAVPDVSLTAAVHDGYIVCLDLSCEGSNPGLALAGGTSASVQAFGGIMALVVQKMAGRVGIANYALYKLAASETLSSCNGSNVLPLLPPVSTCVFNDVTAGNTNIPEVGTLETGFNAGIGYDEATGLGSVNATNLVNQWGTAVSKASTTSLSLNNNSAVHITHGQSVPVGITVAAKAPATGTPTGDVSLIASSSSDEGAASFTLTTVAGNGSVTSTTKLLPGSPTPGGSYSVKAHYEGDGVFLGSDSSAVTVFVSPEPSQTSVALVTPTNNNLGSVVYGDPNNSYVIAVQVISSASASCNPNVPAIQACPTGVVTLTDNSVAIGGSFKLDSSGYFEDQSILLTGGSHSLKAMYAGDNSFSGSTSAADVVTVSKATTTASVAASQTTVTAGTSVVLTATIATQSNATANSSQEPTGTVQFLVNNVAFGTPVAVTEGVNSSTLFAQAVASISPANLAVGQDKISAQYSGDNNYLAGAPSTQVTVIVNANTPIVTTTSLPPGVIHVAYPMQTLTEQGGNAPYVWSITAGSLPTGLAPLSAGGVISGTPTATGTFNFTVQVKDNSGNTNAKALSIIINPPLQVVSPPLTSPVNAGVAYPSAAFTATGGATPYTWSFAGSLPSGLSLSPSGVISGTPNASAVVTPSPSFTVKVTDSVGNTATSGRLTIVVSGFNFTAGSSTPITVATQGSSGTGMITLNVVNGFTGTATLTANVTGTPPGAIDLPVPTFVTPETNFNSSNNTMTFSSSSMTGNVTLNVATTAHSAISRPSNGPLGRGGWPLAVVAASLVCFFLLLSVPKQRRWGFVPLGVLLLISIVAGVSCASGGGGGGGGGSAGTTLGTYTITVSATPAPGGAQAIQTATISLTVN